MANFPSAGSGFARGFSSTYIPRKQQDKAIQFNREQADAASQERRRESFLEQVHQSEEKSVELFSKALEAERLAAQNGADPEMLQEMNIRAQGYLTAHAKSLQAYRAMGAELGLPDEQISLLPDPDEFIESRRAVAQSALEVDQLIAERSQVDTLSPDQLEAVGFPEGAVVQQKSDGTLSIVFNPLDNENSEASLEMRARFLEQSGAPRDKALGIAAGRYQVLLDPLTREGAIMDLVTGEQVGKMEPPEPEAGHSLIPEDVDTAEGLGVSGALKTLANNISDIFSGSVPFEESLQARDAVNTVQQLTTITLQEPIQGRPSNLLLESLKELTVSPNSLFQGDATAKSRLNQTRQLISSEISRMDRLLSSGAISPTDRASFNVNLTQLKQLNVAYDTLIQGLENLPEDVGTPPSSAPPEIKELWQYFSPEERESLTERYSDG